MDVAVYNGLPVHYEIIGFAIDFCKKHCLKFTVYNNFNGEHAMLWKEWYTKLFGNAIEWRNAHELDPNNHTTVLLLTDDDHSVAAWRDVIAYKTVCIQHYHKYRVLGYKYYIGTRWYPDMPDLAWALPVYPIVKTKLDKRLFDNSIHVACVGNFNFNNVADHLKSIFCNFNDITFHVINRRLCVNVADYSNIHIYENASVETMMQIISNSHYAFRICAGEDYTCYQERNMSGIIPIALSCGTRMIMPEKWKQTHKLKSVLTYTDNITLTPELINVEEVLSERDDLIQQRNTLLSDIVL